MTAPAGATGTIYMLHFDRPYKHATSAATVKRPGWSR